MAVNEGAWLGDVLAERDRQEAKWGEQNHCPFVYNAILGEERGEVEKAILEAMFGDGPVANIRKELIEVAAVALAMVEALDRGKCRWSTPGSRKVR